MQKRVLLLNASHNDERLILALRKLNCYIITSGNRPDLLGHKLADEYVYGDYTNLSEMLNLAIEKGIDAVCPCCNDFGVKTAAYISEKLGFSGQDTYKNTLIIHDKDKFKDFAVKIGHIRTPVANGFDSEEKALEWAVKQNNFPLIVKPVDLSAGNGIKRADNQNSLLNNIKEAFYKSRLKRIVIEPFIEGTQHGFCTYLKNQKVIAVCSNNENSFINPYRVEVDTYPSDNYNIVKEDLIAQIEHIAKSLNLTDGIFHLQYIYKDGKAYILECMRRVLGNLYSIPAEGLGQGFDWDYWEVKAKCGFGTDDFPDNVSQKGFWAYRALIATQNGIFRKIEIPENIEKYVYNIRMLHSSGYQIKNHLSDPIGFLFMNFENQKDMKKLMLDEYNKIKIIVDSEKE